MAACDTSEANASTSSAYNFGSDSARDDTAQRPPGPSSKAFASSNRVGAIITTPDSTCTPALGYGRSTTCPHRCSCASHSEEQDSDAGQPQQPADHGPPSSRARRSPPSHTTGSTRAAQHAPAGTRRRTGSSLGGTGRIRTDDLRLMRPAGTARLPYRATDCHDASPVPLHMRHVTGTTWLLPC